MTDTPVEKVRLTPVGAFVDAQVTSLQNRFLSTEHQDPAAVAALARLRRGASKPPGAVLDILDLTLSSELRPGPDDAPSADEWAAHVALTFYATHQQSKGERMHRRHRGLGTALRSLHDGDQKSLPGPLARRFQMLGTADSFEELLHHLRGAVQLLRAGGAPLDYGLLADQLVAWQVWGRDRVQLKWGREFYRVRRTDINSDQPAD